MWQGDSVPKAEKGTIPFFLDLGFAREEGWGLGLDNYFWKFKLLFWDVILLSENIYFDNELS